MKRNVKRIVFVFVLMTMVLSLSGCIKRTPLTTSDFQTKMEEKGFTVRDVSMENSEEVNIQSHYLATHNTSDYQLEFYEFENDGKASAFFGNNKRNIKNYYEDTKSSFELNLLNHSKYEITTDVEHVVIAVTDNTVILATNSIEWKEDVKTVLKEIGY